MAWSISQRGIDTSVSVLDCPRVDRGLVAKKATVGCYRVIGLLCWHLRNRVAVVN